MLAQKSLNYEHMLHTQNGMNHEVMSVLFRVIFYVEHLTSMDLHVYLFIDEHRTLSFP